MTCFFYGITSLLRFRVDKFWFIIDLIHKTLTNKTRFSVLKDLVPSINVLGFLNSFIKDVLRSFYKVKSFINRCLWAVEFLITLFCP